MRRFLASLFLIISAFSGTPFQVFAVTSTNYEIDQENNFISTHHSVSSTNYELDGSLEPIAGKTTSTNYSLESGSPFAGYCGDGFIDPDEDCDVGTYGELLGGAVCTNLGYTGGDLSCGGDCQFDTGLCESALPGDPGAPRPRPATEPPAGPEFLGTPAPDANGVTIIPYTYADTYTLTGRYTMGDTVLIDGQETAVHYYPNGIWRVVLPLAIGRNDFSITIRNDVGTSNPAVLIVYRRIRGDTNGDGLVNDVDLSRFSRRWKTADGEADFNSDQIVDDYDLSMLSAHWTN